MPSNFPPVPSHGLTAGTRGSLGRNYPLPILQRRHLRALHCLRAYQLPKTGECPLWRLPPLRSRGRLAPWAPSLGTRAQCTAHAANGAPGHASCGHPCPLRYPGPPWALGLPRPTSLCPGYPLSDTHRSQPRSQPVNRAPAPLQAGFEPTFPPTAKRPPFLSI